MRISDLESMLARYKEQHGDVQIYTKASNLRLSDLCITTADSVLDQDILDLDSICGILKNEDENILFIG